MTVEGYLDAGPGDVTLAEGDTATQFSLYRGGELILLVLRLDADERPEHEKRQ